MKAITKQKIIFTVFRTMSLVVFSLLFIIIGFISFKGIRVINWTFISSMPEEGMLEGGILPAIVGTLCLVAGSMLVAFPVGVLSGIYIHEFLKDGPIKRFMRLMTDNLAGVPSIVFGLFGMALFVNKLKFGDSILAGSLTLAILALPVIVRTTEEALKSVDDLHRQASYALGASKLYTIRKVVLPVAMPNIITGLILAIGRVSGETAPILFTVAAYFLPKLPNSIFEQAMALPYHLYVLSTSGTDIEKAKPMAYGTALILIAIVLVCNMVAHFIRSKKSRQ